MIDFPVCRNHRYRTDFEPFNFVIVNLETQFKDTIINLETHFKLETCFQVNSNRERERAIVYLKASLGKLSKYLNRFNRGFNGKYTFLKLTYNQ